MNAAPEGLLALLRKGTANEHQLLEAGLNLADPNLSRDEYLHILQCFQAFIARWEQAGGSVCPPQLQQAFAARRRARLLDADLAAMNAMPLLIEPALPPLNTPEAFLGAMYVIEGSTLGGQVISRHLEQSLGLHDGQGYSFFRGHGDQTGRLWKEFCATLTVEAQSRDIHAIVEGARCMFLAFHQWLRSQRAAAV